MNLDFKLVEDALLQFSQIDCCPSTSACSVTFVIRVSKRYADAFASRPDIRTRAGLLAKLGRDFHPDDPMCDYLGDWQPMAVAAPRGTETIVFQGTIERVKEVRNKHPSLFSFLIMRIGTRGTARTTLLFYSL